MYICSSTILYFSAAVVFVQVCGENSNNGTNNATSNGSGNVTFEESKFAKFFKKTPSQVINEKCSSQYSLTCLKIDISKLLDKLESAKSFQIFPGVSLITSENSRSVNNSVDFPTDAAVSWVRYGNSSSELNSYLKQKVGKYLGSLTVRVNLLDNPIVDNLKQLTYNAFGYVFHPVEETGRSKKHGKHDHHAAMWSAAMLAALGLSGLAALAGKAFLTGALALILSIACLLKSCHRGHKASHYEIITKPAHLHSDVEHIGLTAGLSSPSYTSYARQLIQDRIIPAILDTETSDEREMETKVIPVHAYQLSANIPQHQLVGHR